MATATLIHGGSCQVEGAGTPAAPGPVIATTPLASRLYGALVVVLVLAAAVMAPATVFDGRLAAAVGVLGVVALLRASRARRSRPAPTWALRCEDPFPLFALATGLLAAAVLTETAFGPSGPVGLGPADALALVAAIGAGGGFVVMIREATPGRALDSLLPSAIVGTGACLATWVLLVRSQPSAAGHLLGVLLVPTLDVVVLTLGVIALRQRRAAPNGAVVLVLAWFAVLLSHLGDVLLVADGGGRPPGPPDASTLILIALGLLGVAAFEPHTSQAPEPKLQPIRPLSSGQIMLLGAAVLLGPTLVAVQLDHRQTVPVVLALGGLVSTLVFAYLLRLVQGRAVMEHRAHHDELTGLPNRSLFRDRVTVGLAHARRAGGRSALLFVDLDRFKNVNDSLGHAVGNLLLTAVARRLRSMTRAADTVARLGGDEFAVFLAQVESRDEASAIAERVLAAFREPFRAGEHRIFISPSIGIAVSPEDGDAAEPLLTAADIAMYRAKQQGRKSLCVYDRSMNDELHERIELESQLHTAVERGELVLHYQPKIHLPTGRVSGVEALLRWEHPRLGLLEPSRFIPVAEESGLIVPVGEWALEEACRQNEAWRRAGFEPLTVAVNLSPRQFQQQRIEDVTARILRATGLDASLLELEVTESLAMQEPERIRAALQDLRDMGVSCSIDDFGTGYSGLSHLTRLPVDTLKIDKSFVASIEGSHDSPIVVAVIALAHGLGLKVVAEGVETERQLERLRELGCDEMQGFLFSRPLPPDLLEQLLMLESISPGPGRLERLALRRRSATS